ncbi:MAG: CarD family transcriptional regulator [Lachnospiraceae bacterium]|nr:CarD family transcriptional regulator [Lachnospiraceae bacterium]
MFQKDEIVVYGIVGVCKVTDISELDFMADKKMYYTLQPLYDDNRMIYTPVEGHKHKMRPIISKEEAMKFIDRLPTIECGKYANEKERKEAYHEILLSGNLERWASMIHFIYQKEQERAAKGQKISTHYMEEMKSVEKLLLGELAAALDIPMTQMKSYINTKLSCV